jgi:hypothetical protein
MLTETLQPAMITAALLIAIIAGAFTFLFTMRAKSHALEQKTSFYLNKHQDYFTYISINIDGPEALLPPPGKLKEVELKAIQKKLLEWIETIKGSHREKLSDLCTDMGLVELELKRLQSFRHWDRIDAAYHLGIMRAKECETELISLLEREAEDSTAFVIARAAAKCARKPGELRKVILRLAKYHPQSHQLIADIVGSSTLDPIPLYLELLQSEDDNLRIIAMTGLSGRNEPDSIPALKQLAHSANLEVRIKSSKLLLQAGHLLLPDQISAYIHHPDWEIRAAAVKMVGEQRMYDFIDDLKENLSDDNWWVRHHSAKVLAQLGLEGFQTLCETASGTNEGLDRDMAWDAIHDEMESAAALASQDIRQILHFNELSHTYEKMFNESYASNPTKQLRIGS